MDRKFEISLSARWHRSDSFSICDRRRRHVVEYELLVGKLQIDSVPDMPARPTRLMAKRGLAQNSVRVVIILCATLLILEEVESGVRCGSGIR